MRRRGQENGLRQAGRERSDHRIIGSIGSSLFHGSSKERGRRPRSFFIRLSCRIAAVHGQIQKTRSVRWHSFCAGRMPRQMLYRPWPVCPGKPTAHIRLPRPSLYFVETSRKGPRPAAGCGTACCGTGRSAFFSPERGALCIVRSSSLRYTLSTLEVLL